MTLRSLEGGIHGGGSGSRKGRKRRRRGKERPQRPTSTSIDGTKQLGGSRKDTDGMSDGQDDDEVEDEEKEGDGGDGNRAEHEQGWDKIIFNFPHIGGKSRDVNRQVRYNQGIYPTHPIPSIPLSTVYHLCPFFSLSWDPTRTMYTRTAYEKLVISCPQPCPAQSSRSLLQLQLHLRHEKRGPDRNRIELIKDPNESNRTPHPLLQVCLPPPSPQREHHRHIVPKRALHALEHP